MKTLDRNHQIDEAFLKVPLVRKPMDGPMADSYSPKAALGNLLVRLVGGEQGFFSPDYPTSLEILRKVNVKFVMVVPPPNVTSSLHLGHTLTIAVDKIPFPVGIA